MKAKRTLSALLTLLLLVSVLACLPLTGSAEAEPLTITYTNPAITADAGETISLSQISVQLDKDTTTAASSITWSYEGKVITEFTPKSKGVYTLKATTGSQSKDIYVVAKEASETEYVLYENEFSGTLDDLKADGWNFLTTVASVSDGALHLGNKDGDYYRVILPAWLSDFGDYSITIESNQTNVTDTSRWSSIVYRCENDNSNYYPYYHMCVRANTTTNTVEFAERTSGNVWNVIYTTSETINMTEAGTYHELTVRAFENVVEYLVDGESVLFVSDATGHTKGYIGLTSNFGTMNVDSIRITVQTSAPTKPAVASKLINTADNRTESNITNYVSNQAYATVDTFDALIADEAHPVAILLDVTGKTLTAAEYEKYLSACKENGIIPEFKMDSTAQVDLLVDVIAATGTPEALVASEDEAIVKYARNKKRTVLRAALDLTGLELKRLSVSDIYDIYDKAVGAYAQAVILPYHLATKENVAALQEYELAVWAFGTGVDTDTEAAWLVASGANAVVSDNWKQIAEVQTEIFTAENSLTRTPVWTGHRGYPTKYPENSMSSYIGAYNTGADCVETDIHLTADNVLVICHDDTIDRTTNGSGTIANMTLEQIRSYNLLLNGRVTDEVIPTFEEMLQYFQGKDIKILCELKSSQTKLSQEAVNMVKKYGMEDQVVFISFYPNQLTRAKAYMNVTTGYLLSAISYVDASDTVGTLNAYYTQQTNCLTYNSTIAINYSNLTAEFLRDANDRGMTLWTWTYSNAAATSVCNMFLAGMNGMTTNDTPYLQNTVKTISSPTKLYVESNGQVKFSVQSETYLGTLTDITGNAVITELDNDGVITIGENGAITAKKDGTATFIASYETKLPNGTKYTLYTQPVTVIVGEIPELTLNDNSKYTLENNILTGVTEQTTVEELLSSFANAGAITVYNASGKQITDTSVLVGNGFVLSYSDIDTLVVLIGDIDGNGKVEAKDYMMLKRHVLGTYELNDIQKLAADIDGSGEAAAKDYMMLKRHVLGTFDIYQ